MNKKANFSSAKLVFEELEPRLLLSADGLGVLTESSVATLQTLVHSENENIIIVQHQTEQTSTVIHNKVQNDSRSELVIIDSRAPNFQQLHNDVIKAQQQGRDINVVILDAHRDGLEQISDALNKYNKLDAVHIVSHGKEGQLQLGATQLNNQNLKQRSDEINQWKQVFSDGGDLLIYGCNLAGSANGTDLVNSLSDLTGTDVAASDDVTGNNVLGGDWDLEYQTGDIETSIAFTDDIQDNWQGALNADALAAEQTAVEEQQQEEQVQAEQEAALIAELEAVLLAEEKEAETITQEPEQQAGIVEEQRLEIVFIDESVHDYQSFIDDLQANSDASTSFEIVLLDGNSNGIEQINETLFAYNDVDALHIISHGDDGAVKLGNTWLNASNLGEYNDTLNTWGSSLDADADILIYGCNLAESENGEQFVNRLAQITGADVAASDDLTGHVSQGGDWKLEFNTGSIESTVAISAEAQQQWNAVLAETVYEFYATVSEDKEVKSSDSWGQTFSHTSGGGTYDVNQISLQLYKDGAADLQNITVSLHSTWNGAALASATMSSDDLTTSMAEYDFSFADVTLTDGTTYYIKVITDVSTGKVFVGGDNGSSYANGTQIDKNGSAVSGRDLAFSVSQVQAETFTVSTTADSGPGSLRQAILDANANVVAVDTINFSIAGTGPHIINLSSALPAITDTININGNSEPDYTGAPVVRIDGSSAGSGNGLTFSDGSDGSSVQGLMITGFTGYGIQIDSGADGVSIKGNWIGTTGTGSTGVGNSNTGINVQGANTIIGGTGANEGNVITSNSNEGINLTGTGATGTIIQGNIIGLDPDGSSGSGNTDVGIAVLSGAHNTTIGGTTPEARNIISNNYEGIEINSNNNTIQGNYIGTDITGTLDRGNDSDDGIEIQNNATGNIIGGSVAGAGNLVAFNALDGVNLFNGSGNTVLGNSIHSNGDLGIDLGASANNAQSFPVLSNARTVGNSIRITGTLNSSPSTTFRIEFFASTTADGSGYGEADRYLGFVDVTTSASDADTPGFANILTDLAVRVADGEFITATATVITNPAQVGIDDAAAFGNSSEFSLNVAAVALTSPPINTVTGAQTVAQNTLLPLSGISVYDVNDNLSTVQLSVINGDLNVTLSGAATISAGGNGTNTLTISGNQTDINATLTSLTYQGNLNYTGSDNLTVLSTDSNAATDTDVVAITVFVNSVPTASNNTVVTNEDVTYTFNSTDFNFSDVDAGDSLQQVQITSLPVTGTLKLSGTDVTLNQIITVNDINAGNLSFMPVSEQSGTGYDAFDFKVSDGNSAGATGSVLNSFVAPSVNSMSGVAFDGTNIWLAGQTADTIYQLDTDGNTLNSFAAPGTNPTGLAFDGTNLWVISRDADTVYEIDTSGNVLSSFATPGTDSRGLAWDGSNLWLVEGTGQQIYQLSTTGSVVSNFAWPDDYIRDVTWDGTNLWLSDQNDQLIHEVNTSGTILSSFAAPSTGAAGLVFDGNSFWHADADTDTIYQLTSSNSVTLSAAAYTMSIDVNAVNDAPTAADKTIITPEDTTYTFTLSDFGYSDVDGDTIAVVRILPIYNNVVELDGTVLAASTIHNIAIADITAGKLTFEPPADGVGTADIFYFSVNDGTVDSNAHTMSVTVTPVNDAPVANADPGVYTNELASFNPLSYWRLGETTGAAADLGSSANAGTYNGGSLNQSGGISGDIDTSVYFDGSDYIEVAHSDDYLLDNGTIQLWFNADNVANGNLQHLFSKDSQGNDTGGHVSMYLTATGYLEVRMQSTSSSYVINSTSTVSQGEWHHAALTFGAGGMELYLDGQLVDTNVYTGGLGTTSGGIGNYEPIAIGGGTQNSDNLVITPVNQFFTGKIDEVAILNSQLGAQSIQQLYDAGTNQFTVNENATLTVAVGSGVLANDSDVDGDSLTVSEINGNAANIGNSVTLASGALVTLNADGSVFYDPNGQFETLDVGQTATDSFNYTVIDGNGGSDTATVTVTINGVEYASIVTDDGSGYSTSIIDLGAEGYWRLGESTGPTAVDETGNHDGTYTGTTLGVAGAVPINTAADFDDVAGDHIDVGNFDVAGTGITMMGWFNADDFGAGDPRIISKADSFGDGTSNHSWMLGTWDSGGDYFLRMRLEAGGTTNTLVSSTGALNPGQWYFAVATYDSATGEMKIFLDGSEVASANHSVGGAVTTDPSRAVVIGGNPSGNKLFDGKIDEVAVFDHALDLSQVQDLYNARYGTFTGSVTEGNVGDAAVTASGVINITDQDSSDNPAFNDVLSTPGSNAYGNFTLTSGNWVYTLDQAAVQQLGAGETVQDSITFTATDGTDQVVTVTITGANDTPTNISLDNSTVDENSAVGTLVGNLGVTDIDAVDTAVYTLVAGSGDADNASFQIVGGQLQTNAVLDFEAQSSYSIRVQVEDSVGETFEKILTISANDITEYSIEGAIYEDVNGDGNLADQVGAGSITVHLYIDSGDGIADGVDDTLVSTTTTNATGQYQFNNLIDGTYWVVVDSKTVTASASMNATFNQGDVWAEQTYASSGALVANGAGGTVTLGSAGVAFGGRQGDVSDNASSLATSEHVTAVTMAGSDITGIDSAFSFNVVTGLRGGDAADDDTGADRTVQGSLRQFIDNANAINGVNAMRFIPTVATNATDGAGNDWWRLNITNALPQITDAFTSIDGTAYQLNDGVTVRDDNAGQFGTGGTVGLDDLALSQVDRPELEIVGSNTISYGFSISASNASITDLAIYGFGNSGSTGDFHLSAGATDTNIQGNIIGTSAGGLVDPGAGLRSGGSHIYSAGADNVVVQNNFIGFGRSFGIFASSNSDSWQITDNEFSFNGILHATTDSVTLLDSDNAQIIGNLMSDNQLGSGIDIIRGSGTEITNNLITENGGGTQPAGIRLYGTSGITISRTEFSNNTGPGIVVQEFGASSSSNNTITENTFSSNGGLAIDLVAGGNPGDVATGDGVTDNDLNDSDTGANDLQNFPVLSSVETDASGTITIAGSLNTDGLNQDYRIEVYASTVADSSGHGEAERYLGAITVTTDGSGNVNFSENLSVNVAIGEYISATAMMDSGGGNYGSTSEFALNIQAIAYDVNTATVVNQSLTVAEGDTNVVLTLLDLQSTDSDTTDVSLIYTVGNVTSGSLTINGSAWAAVTNESFTQQDIIDGNVLYSHDDSNTSSDSFSYSVADPAGNTLAGQTFSITVTAIDDDAPTVVNQSVTVAEGVNNVALTTTDLSSTDLDTTDTTLIYTVSDVTNGSLSINGSAWASGTNDSFTQQDIIDGNVLYSHDGTNTTSDSFSYTVEDPTGNTLAGQTFLITVTAIDDDAPTAVNQSVTVAEGATDVVLTTTDLFSTDLDTADTTLIYTVSDVTNGSLSINGSAWAAGTNETFTQQDIIDGNVLYSHDGTNTTSDSFSYSVADPTGNTLAGQTFSITVNAVNDAPVLGAIGNQSVNELVNLSFTATATDSDLPADTLTFSLDAASLAAGMTIDANTGVFSWTPAEGQGGSTPSVTITVTDSGTGNLIDSETFTITVNDVNVAPVLGAIGNQTVDELATFNFTAAATDSDLPVDTLSFSLDAASITAGMTIDANTGAFSWTPTEAQGGSTPSVTITVTDNGTGNLIDSETFTITVAEVNIAPVLTGANDLSSITEDDISNAGTLVSDLISGHFSDADGMSSSGIAVVGTDNSNGSWEYTIDGGSNWLAFGSPSSGFARLLAADANTLVRFVPSADYNGTVSNGITFHAWDQTTGSSGDVVNLSGFDSGADSFSTVSYSNNDGTTPWASDWIESDSNGGGASSGYSSINAGSLQLQLAAGDGGDNIYREIDLSGATVATLSFDYQNVLSGEDEIRVQVSNNGGGSYSTVQTFSGTANTGSGTASIDISTKIASDTRIRFFVFKNDSGNDLFIDNLAVTYDNGDPLPGGETAFSALTQSSSITVTPVDDLPTVDNIIPDQIATEDTAYSFTFADNTFGNVDTSDTLTYSATLADNSALPGWLSFNASTRVFSGTPTNADVGAISVKVTADDGTSTISDTFILTINNTNDAAIIAGVDSGAVQEDVSVIANNISTSGLLTITDVDTGEASFVAGTINGTYGDLVMQTDGNWTYTADNTQAAIQQLDLGENITDTLTVSSFDGTTHNVVITINGSDDAAVISGTTTGSVTEDGTLTSTGALTITDTDTSDPTDFVDVAATASDFGYGTFELTGNIWTYTLNNNHVSVQALDVGETLSDTYTFIAPDGVSQEVTVTINGAEDTPVFDSTAVTSATEDSAYSYSITTSDVDVEAVTITATTLPGWLTLIDNGDGTATLSGTPANADVGDHSVVLNVDDGEVNSNQSFTITVANTNDAPVLSAIGNQSVNEVVNLSFTATATDSDLPADTLTFSLDAASLAAGMTIDANTGVFSWTPTGAQGGTAPLVTVTVTDSGTGNLVDSETFIITVYDAPVANYDTANVNEGQSVIINLAANDTDMEGAVDLASIVITSAPSNGSVVVNADGTVNYTHDGSETIADSFAYTIMDATGAVSNVATVTLTVNPVNDAPTAQNDTPAAVNEGGTAIFDLVVNDFDLDNALDLNSIAIIGAPVNGSLIVNGNGTVTYSHDGSETTSDSFSYTIADISGAISNTATVTITVNPLNDAPSAVDDVLTVDEGNSINIDLAANDIDADNSLDLNSIVIVGAPVNGTLIVNGNGTVDYTHDGSETGSDSFTYTITDISGAISNVATVNIAVNSVNDSPTTAGIANVTVLEDPVSSSTINLNAAFDDADNVDSDLTYTITGNTSIGLFTSTAVNAATGELVLDYAANMNGSSQISIRATDPSGEYVETLFTVTVTPVNDVPEVMVNAGLVAEDAGSTTISNAQLDVNDIDNTNAEILYTITELPAHGELLINGVAVTIGSGFSEEDLVNNNVSYQPGGTGANDQFGFTVSDGAGGSITGNSFSIVVQLAAVVPDEPVEPEVIVELEKTLTEKPVTEKVSVTQVAPLTPIVDQGFKPIGGNSTPQQQQPVLTLDPVVEKEEVENIDEIVDSYMVDEEREVSEVDFSTTNSYADIQVKAIKALLNSIDKMKQEVSENVVDDFSNIETRSAAVSGSGVALTAGVVAWVLRSGAVMASLLTSIPLWKGYDPLPLLVYKDDEEKEEVTEEKIPTSLAELKKVKALKEKMEQQMKVDRLFGHT